MVEEAEKYKCKIDDSSSLYDTYFFLPQVRTKLQLLLSLQRISSNLTPNNLCNSQAQQRELAISFTVE